MCYRSPRVVASTPRTTASTGPDVAWERVRADRGAAGVDRLTLEEVEDYGVQLLLAELAADLRADN